MMLTKKQLDKYRLKLSKITSYIFTLYPNGIFNALDIKQEDLSTILSKIKSLDFIGDLSAAHYRRDNDENLYQIYGQINTEKIEEDITINNKLNPKLWTDDNKLLPEVEQKINEIANHFVSSLREDGIEINPVDVYLVGSNVNYNYTDESDLDIHIIADQSFDCVENHLTLIYTLYKSIYNKKYDLKINGIDVELYVENAAAFDGVTAAIYSMKNGWIKTPKIDSIPEIDNVKLDKMINEWEERYFNIIKNPTLELVDKYIVDIYELRHQGLAEKSEFALGNLVFKEMRKLGYLDELKTLRDKLQSEILSL